MGQNGCAFEMKGGETSRYYASPAVTGFADFVRYLHENRGSADKAPRPIPKRIPQAEELTEGAWREIAESGGGYGCVVVIDIRENRVEVKENTGAGMAAYTLAFTAVMQAAAADKDNL